MNFSRGQGAIELHSGATAGAQHGQGATEYLVLLAVVLIVALVSVALLGFFPGMASDAKITQSEAYWRGQARPFAIVDSIIGATGNATLTIQNKEASGQYTITNILIGNVNSTNLAATPFAPGETKNILFNTTAMNNTGFGATNALGAIYEYNVTITYNTPNINGVKQYGAKNLIDKYV